MMSFKFGFPSFWSWHCVWNYFGVFFLANNKWSLWLFDSPLPSFYGVSFPVAQPCQDGARWWCSSAVQQVQGCSCCSSSAVPALCPALSAVSGSPGLAWCSGALPLAQWHPPPSCSCKSSGKPRPVWRSGCGPWRSEPAPCLWKQRDTIRGDTGWSFPLDSEGFCSAPALFGVWLPLPALNKPLLQPQFSLVWKILQLNTIYSRDDPLILHQISFYLWAKLAEKAWGLH